MTWKNLWLGHARNFCCKEHSPVGVGGGGTLVSFDTYGFFIFPPLFFFFFLFHTQLCSVFFSSSSSYQSFLMAYNGAARTAAFHWFSFSFLSFFFFRLFCLLLLAFCLIVNVFKERNATQYHIGSSFLASILFLFLFAHFWLYHSHTGSAVLTEGTASFTSLGLSLWAQIVIRMKKGSTYSLMASPSASSSSSCQSLFVNKSFLLPFFRVCSLSLSCHRCNRAKKESSWFEETMSSRSLSFNGLWTGADHLRRESTDRCCFCCGVSAL